MTDRPRGYGCRADGVAVDEWQVYHVELVLDNPGVVRVPWIVAGIDQRVVEIIEEGRRFHVRRGIGSRSYPYISVIIMGRIGMQMEWRV